MLIFFDLEVTKNNIIKLIGATTESNKDFQNKDEYRFEGFISDNKGSYFVGHNIINHDLKFFKNSGLKKMINENNSIDTLFLSTLLFPNKPYHSLVKDDKLKIEQLNNPVNDSKNARVLFYDIVEAFNNLDKEIKDVYYFLLRDIPGFKGLFSYLNYRARAFSITNRIKNTFKDKICDNSDLSYYIKNNPVELAYALALINTTEVESILPAWVLKQYSAVENILENLRNKPCNRCNYCKENLNSLKGLKKYFGYDSFRKFEGENLQQEAADAALEGKSLIAVFPTGGGKSLTFQLPALISRESTRGLTVVISPLQSLMKDQVDSLENKNITSAVSISGLLDPIERTKAIQRVADGSASILYIAPESLRSKTIERLILSRQITRVVIDEAHCFSSWGHDFRVDYLYIGPFIKMIQEKKNLNNQIPISCFTATAKVDVIRDIKDYFKKHLDLEMESFITTSQRENLEYFVYPVEDREDRYRKLRNLLLETDEPTIIYCSRVKSVEELHKNLSFDSIKSAYFHGRLEKDIKVEQQDAFMSGDVNIMIATSAFGMGIDKDNVKRVIHYEISDSLENYMQESGRAGRDFSITAKCYILYNEEDLNKHFDLLNSSKLNIDEIQQMWRGIKQLTKDRPTLSNSSLELAKQAGWNESSYELDTRVKTAVSSLEQSGYVQRQTNSPRVFADSLLANSVMEANKKIDDSKLFEEHETILAKRIVSNLISNKHRNKGKDETAETRIDYLADILGVNKYEVIQIVNKLREAKIISDDKDLFANIEFNQTSQRAKIILNSFIRSYNFLLNHINDERKHINIKQLKELMAESSINVRVNLLKRIINYLEISNVLKIKRLNTDNFVVELTDDKEKVESTVNKRIDIASFIIDYLYHKAASSEDVRKNNILPFSIIEIKNEYNKQLGMLNEEANLKEIEESIYLLIRIDSLKIEGGFLIVYSPLNIEKLELNPHVQYKKEDYELLENYYQTRKEQIHVIGEFANKMVSSNNEASLFVNDYFTMEFNDFLNKYFPGERKKELDYSMTPAKFDELFGALSEEQLNVILDKKNDRIGVAAGPGSGKTRLLVHKLASILHTEDIRQEQLLMLTFSRQAALEFKERLHDLIGSAAHYIHITTFHSYAFDITESMGNSEKFDLIIEEATNAIKNNTADPFKITKSVLVIDEAQDMTQKEFEFISEIINYNPGIRVIAVGDDDQNIYEFRDASSKYLKEFSNEGEFYELSVNFRSLNNLVMYSNAFIKRLKDRLKKKEISSYKEDNGEIHVTQYNSNNLTVPVVDQIIKDNRKGTIAVITYTNEEAIQIMSLLNKEGLSATLIQTLDDFRLFDMYEIRLFYNKLEELTPNKISQEHLDEAFTFLKEKTSKNKNYQVAVDALNRLLPRDNEEIFMSDLNNLLFETYNSDIYKESNIVISTFHKAKGKEFDNVYIVYPYEKIDTDADVRKFYVGITRAKSFLSIHTNIKSNRSRIPNTIVEYNIKEYIEPDYIEVLLNHKDINLGWCKTFHKNIINTWSGKEIYLDDKNTLKDGARNLTYLSKKGSEDHLERLNKGYKLVKVEINHLVYWYDVVENNETLIVLPKLVYKKIEESEELELELIINSTEIENENKSKEEIKKENKDVKEEPTTLKESLLEFRRQTAKIKKIPLYIIFNNKSLDDLLKIKPTDKNQLLEVYGFGDKKVEEYGDEILSIMNKYINKV